MNARRSGFTLLEVAVVTALLGMVSYLFLPSLVDAVERGRIEREDRILGLLSEEIQRSFSAPDAARNISSLRGDEVGGASLPTWFDGYEARSGVVSGSEWFAKLGRARGLVVHSEGAVSREQQTALYALAWNEVDQPRWLIAAPSEPGQQRYLLVSCLAPFSRGMALPALADGAVFFESVWNHDWDNPSAGLPEAWRDHLAFEQESLWLNPGGAPRTRLLRVSRIVQPKHRLLINNTHATNSVWVDVEGIANVVTSLPGSGVTRSMEFLAGRTISVRRGISAPGLEVLRFHLHEETSITVQP